MVTTPLPDIRVVDKTKIMHVNVLCKVPSVIDTLLRFYKMKEQKNGI